MSTSYPPVQASFENYLRKSWFHRNWKWFVPTFLVAAVGCFVVGVLGLVQYSFRHSDVYAMALQKAQQSQTVVNAIGPSIKPGWFSGGSIQLHNDSGWAELSIPVSAERGEGSVYIRATKREGVWRPSVLVFESAAGGERTDLLKEAEPRIIQQ